MNFSLAYKVAPLVVFLALTGCATVTGSSSNQSISVQTFAADGTEMDGVRCDMSNDEGTWFVMTPGSTMVHRSNKDLQVICKKSGVDIGTASVVSRTKGNMWGNVILGGGIGAVVDHNNGTAYEYPGLVKVFMGRANQKIDENSSQATFTPSTPEQKTTTTPPVTSSKVDVSLDDAKQKCKEIGFKPGTENFGSCVLKLAK